MLQKKYRLNKAKDIKNTSERGRSFFSPNFVVKYRPEAELEPRVAVVVSNYVSKKAVERNRLKRLVRETIRLNLGKLKKGDYVIIVRPKAAKSEEEVARSGLLNFLTTLKLLK